jgi:peptidoglycan/LPS O-acetylase OafA/YrhL
MQERTHIPTIDWIQALRGIAAVLVVFTHARVVLAQGAGQELAWKYLVHGAVGVDLFFIISGFIMVLTTRSSDGSVRYVADFLVKRFSRVWPLLLVVSTVYLLRIWWIAGTFPVDYFQALLSQLAFRPVSPHVSEFYSLPVDVSWTLCFEAYFYGVVAVSLFFGKWRWWAALAILLMGLAISPIAGGELSLHFYQQPAIHVNHYLNLVINPVVWDFIYGLVAGQIYLSLKKGPPVAVAVLLLVLAAAAFVSVPFTHQAGLYGPTVAGGGATVFFAFMLILLASKSIRIPVASWLLWLGKISYAVYLTHRLGFLAAAEVGEWFKTLGLSVSQWEWLTFGVYLLSGIAAGALFHRFAEAPLSDAVRKGLQALISALWGFPSAKPKPQGLVR